MLGMSIVHTTYDIGKKYPDIGTPAVDMAIAAKDSILSLGNQAIAAAKKVTERV